MRVGKKILRILGIGGKKLYLQALLYPEVEFSLDALKDAVYLPYFQMFGELFIERVEGYYYSPDYIF